MKKIIVLVFTLSIISVHAQTKPIGKADKFSEISSFLMEAYYSMNFSITTNDHCSKILKRRLNILCDSLESRINDSKQALLVKLGDKDLKDLEFQISNYRQYALKSSADITPQQEMSVKLWVRLAKDLVEKLFIKLSK